MYTGTNTHTFQEIKTIKFTYYSNLKMKGHRGISAHKYKHIHRDNITHTYSTHTRDDRAVQSCYGRVGCHLER